jgi:protein-S-isoprenylcysteine O-methyltransferase Ste14
MSLIPAFEIGIWNAWILQAFFILLMFIPDLVMGKEAKERTGKATQHVPFSKTEKRLALSTHVVIMPIVAIYSIFLPLKTGTAWLYIGLFIYVLALVMTVMVSINFAATPIDKPVTRGVYRISRHPIYVSGFLLYVGMGIACASWILLLLAVAWLVLWCIVVPAEERHLLKLYGDAYRKYMDRTPRWIGIPKS